jgi:hypothetical protein
VENEIGTMKIISRKCEDKYELLKYKSTLSQFVALMTELIGVLKHN